MHKCEAVILFSVLKEEEVGYGFVLFRPGEYMQVMLYNFFLYS